MTDAEFRRGLFVITGLALVLPPATGTIVMSFVGFYPFPEILNVFGSWVALYNVVCFTTSFWLIARYARFVISCANSSFSDRALRLLKTTPWLLLGILILYFIGGVLTANASMEQLGYADYTAAEQVFSLFAVTPAVLITALPLLFSLMDHMGRYLAPRGVLTVIAPMWMRLTVLGLFTPVMIDSLLIAYFYDRTGFFGAETFVLWLVLLGVASAGTYLAWRSFKRSLKPAQTYLDLTRNTEDTEPITAPLIPASLDEIGEMISSWQNLVRRRMAAERKLRESERRLQQAMNIAKIGYYIWDFEKGRNVYCSDEFAALHGMSVEEYLTEIRAEEDDIALIHPDDRAKYIKAMDERSATRDPIVVEYRIVGKDGVIRHVREVETVPEWRGDVPTQMEGILLDVTDFRAVERDLRENEARLVDAQRIAKMGDFSWDLRTGVVQRSENAYRIWERSPAELEPNCESYIESIHPDDREIVEEALRSAREGKSYSIDYRITVPSGGARYIHEDTELEFDRAGRPVKLSGTVQDITQRRLVEDEVRQLNRTLETRVERRTQELEDEKKRAEDYLNIAAELILALDENGNVTLINDSGCEMLGYRREELIGQNWFDICVPEDAREAVREEVRRDVLKIMGDGTQTKVSHLNPVLTKSGDRRMIKWHDSPIVQDGRIVGALSSGEDVTDRLEAEAALRRSEREARLLSDSLPVGLTYNTKDLVYRRVNPTYAAWFGKTPEEIQGTRVQDVIDKQGLPFIMEQLDKVLAGNVNEFQRTVPTSDGPRELQTTQVPYITENGDVEGFISIVMDVTERLKAEQTLRRREREASLIAASLPGGMTYNFKDFRYRRVNATYASWFGKTPEEFEGKHPRDFIGDEGMKELEKHFHIVMAGEPHEYERTMQLPGGSIEIRANLVPYIGEDGEIDGFFSFIWDVTDKKRADEQLRHAQKMESLGNLAGGVAHSLNNLLVPIVGLSRMSADDLPEGSDQREVLERIHGASERARDIVARILAFSRQEKVSSERCDLAALIRSALSLAASSLQSNVAMTVGMTGGELHVDMDKVQIEALFLNIFNNAVAAIGDETGGEINVELGQVSLGPVQAALIDPQLTAGSYAKLLIEDNGVGMDEHTKAHIFEPFFTTKEVGKGTGLGLSMAHGIIRGHGGAITVESEPGKGTQFVIYLPLANM